MHTLRSPNRNNAMHGSNPELSTLHTSGDMAVDPLNITLRKRKKPEDDVKQNFDDFREEMMSFLTSFSTVQNENLNKMRLEIASDIREQISVISSLSQKMIAEHNQLKAEVLEVKQRISLLEDTNAAVSSLPKSLSEAHETIQLLLKENNNSKQFALINNLEISGIPQAKGENLMSILRHICLKVGFTLQDGDVDMINRVRRYHSDSGIHKDVRPPAIIVRFTQRKRKDELLSAVRARRGITTTDLELPGPASNVYIGDHLTPSNKLLLKRARQMKNELQYSYLWIRDCKIQMRKNDNSRVMYINSYADLDNLK